MVLVFALPLRAGFAVARPDAVGVGGDFVQIASGENALRFALEHIELCDRLRGCVFDA